MTVKRNRKAKDSFVRECDIRELAFFLVYYGERVLFAGFGEMSDKIDPVSCKYCF